MLPAGAGSMRQIYKFFSYRWPGLLLGLIFVVSLAAVLLAHDSDFLRKPFCAAVPVCPSIANAVAWDKIAYDLGIGGLTSVVFYLLLVWLPEWRRRRRIKRGFAMRYRNFKYDVISMVIGLVEGSYGTVEVEALFEQERFRHYFKESISSSESRWNRFANRLTERPDMLVELLTIFESFRDEIQFVVESVDIQNEETFEFFKRLSAALHSRKTATVEYDDIKSLLRFMWELFSGWSFTSETPYRKEDLIQKMIDAI